MLEKLKNEKAKEISKIVGICVGVLVCLFILSFVMFKIFTNIRQEEMQTLSQSQQNGKENIEPAEEVVELIDPESIEEEQLEDEDEENLTEEEKQKREEEKKKQEEERKKKEEEDKKAQSQKYPYWIKVNYTANTVTVYGKDAEGNYTVPVKAMVCSTGASTPRSGVYKTPQKARWGTLIGPSYGQYCTRITGQILFHSVPYLKRDGKTILEYWEYDRLGETRSLGCIRLTVADAKWLYDNCPLGTSVEFYSSAIPGPLGKPSAKKISGYDDTLRVWDPTDPDPNNPWRNQAKKEEEERKAKEEAEKKAKEEAAKKAQEEEKKKQEEAKKKAEAEQAKKQKEAEEARKRAEQEEARRRQEAEEAERIRREQEEAERIRREQEAQNNAGNTSGDNSNTVDDNGNTANDNTVDENVVNDNPNGDYNNNEI